MEDFVLEGKQRVFNFSIVADTLAGVADCRPPFRCALPNDWGRLHPIYMCVCVWFVCVCVCMYVCVSV